MKNRANLLVIGAALMFCPWTTCAGEVTEKALPAEVTLNGVEFVLVPAGEFWFTVSLSRQDIVSPETSPYRDVRVWLPDYYIARYEARARDYLGFMNTVRPQIPELRVLDSLGNVEVRTECGLEPDQQGGYRLSEAFRNQPDLPAANLSWALADQFARWMGFRLPSEAEWQKAARGPDDKRLWPWGNTYPDDTHAHFNLSGMPCAPIAVNELPKGKSPYGIFNMAGNAGEWVLDWDNEEFDSGLRNGQKLGLPPTAMPSKSSGKLQKGGRWGSGAPITTIPFRNRHDKDYYFNSRNGVRFAVDAETVLHRMRSQPSTAPLPSRQ